MIPRILVIAGSDSGGGAGIQADIKTITMLGGHAMTAITAITAQNTLGVTGLLQIPTETVLAQMDAVIGDIGVEAIKIGMIGSPETAETVAERLKSLTSSRRRPGSQDKNAADCLPDPGFRPSDGLLPIVFDPVMVASSGSTLADAATIAAFERLMAVATLVTPNLPELEVLSGCAIATGDDLEAAGRTLAERTGTAVLAKGGHLAGEDLTDVLIVPGGEVVLFQSQRIETSSTHGTGCTLASAIATGLARGRPLRQAIEAARSLVRLAMLQAPGFGAGHGPMGHHAVGAMFGAMNMNQVTLSARDYAASVDFYRTLGLRQIVDAPPRYARFECPGGATLSIHAEEGAGAREALIYLESDALDAWVAGLQQAGLAFASLPEDQSWGWREARLADPAGNPLCLYQAGENRRFPPWRIGEG